MKRKFSVWQLVRHLIQIAAFVLVPGLFITVFSSLKSIATTLVAGSFSWAAMSYDLVVIAAVLPITLLWGRFFCGWLCSFGAAGDLLAGISGKIFKRRPTIGPKADKVLKYLKYVLLLAIVGLIWILDISPDTGWNPWHIFGLYSRPEGYGTGEILSIGGGLLLVIFVLEFFFERFFCRYLCPLGAIFSLLAKGNLFRIRRRADACVGCGACDRACPMGNPVSDRDPVPSGECIGCMRCTERCPTKALTSPRKGAIQGIVASVLIIALYLGGTAWAATVPVPVSVSPNAVSGLNLTGVADGTYTGTGTGYRGEMTAEVVVSGGEITSVSITSYRDDYRFMVRALYSIPAAIVEHQSLDVSAVSGATFSSNGIVEAVANALDVDFENPNSTLSRGHHHHGPSGEGGERGPSREMGGSRETSGETSVEESAE